MMPAPIGATKNCNLRQGPRENRGPYFFASARIAISAAMVAEEGVAGAQRFSAGRGRHGDFDAI